MTRSQLAKIETMPYNEMTQLEKKGEYYVLERNNKVKKMWIGDYNNNNNDVEYNDVTALFFDLHGLLKKLGHKYNELDKIRISDLRKLMRTFKNYNKVYVKDKPMRIIMYSYNNISIINTFKTVTGFTLEEIYVNIYKTFLLSAIYATLCEKYYSKKKRVAYIRDNTLLESMDMMFINGIIIYKNNVIVSTSR